MFISTMINSSSPKYSCQKLHMTTKPYANDSFQRTGAKPVFKGWKNPFGDFSERQIELLTEILYKLDDNDFTGALPLAKKLRKIHPENHFVHEIEGVVSNELGDTQGAIAGFTRAIELNSGTPDSMDDLAHSLDARGQLYMKTDNPEKAVDDFSRCLEIESKGFKSLPI